jgi:general stress protein 26
MTDQADIEAKFWKALKSDRTLMLGLTGDAAESQPMTAQLEGDDNTGPIWIFTAKDTDLTKAIGQSHGAVAQFVSKGHDLFASIRGQISLDNDRATIDRLWNPFVAAWFEGGKDDPKLQLLRFDASEAQIWLNENSLFAGVKMLFGVDPKKDYKDKMAEVQL